MRNQFLPNLSLDPWTTKITVVSPKFAWSRFDQDRKRGPALRYASREPRLNQIRQIRAPHGTRNRALRRGKTQETKLVRTTSSGCDARGMQGRTGTQR